MLSLCLFALPKLNCIFFSNILPGGMRCRCFQLFRFHFPCFYYRIHITDVTMIYNYYTIIILKKRMFHTFLEETDRFWVFDESTKCQTLYSCMGLGPKEKTQKPIIMIFDPLINFTCLCTFDC